MKNAYEVLRQKELEFSKVEAEVEALRLVAPLLVSNDNEVSDDNQVADSSASTTMQSRPNWLPLAVNSSPRPADASRDDRVKNWP